MALIVNLLGGDPQRFLRREKLAVGLTATVSDLKDWFARRCKMNSVPATNLLMAGWRRDFVLPILLEVLDGKRSVRIADLQAESPFALESVSDCR